VGWFNLTIGQIPSGEYRRLAVQARSVFMHVVHAEAGAAWENSAGCGIRNSDLTS
jgi:hypothetical protein